MKITYNWLKDFVDIDVSAHVLADKLTNSGFEVEEIIYQNAHLHDVKVGKIIKIEKHPDADKLQVCQVDIGDKNVQIITAATNIFEGAVVPVSLPGADLVNGVKIQKSKLRGVESEGMFCSGEELGIDDSYFEGASINGILILPSNFEIGQNIDTALGLDDVILDVNITPNRPDCMSVIGIAREICAILGKKFKDPDLTYECVQERSEDNLSVLRESNSCPRYMAAVIKNVKIEKSPLWVRQRLFAVGIKSINTIVDLTNYVLVEMGQPLHAFDKSKIEGDSIIVRDAKENEPISVLNHNSYKLSSQDLVISDVNKALVIAGVIGGVDSCITDETHDVVIESAVFDLKSIRLTSKKIGVRTDSSARYEKGVYFSSAEQGIKRLLNLVYRLQLGDILNGIIDKFDHKPESKYIECSCEEINNILGVKVPEKNISNILSGLGIKCNIEKSIIKAWIPSYREDLENCYDLAEEIIRIYGYDVYDKCDNALFDKSKVTEGGLDDKTLLERKLKKALVFNGFFESVSFSICPSDICEKLNINDNRKFMVKIANPISDEISCLRTTMAHSMLSNLAYNFSVGNKQVNLFESGRVYLPESLPVVKLPEEINYISLGSIGMSFFEFKACILSAVSETNLKFSIVRSKQPYLHPGISADLVDENGVIYATFGQLHPLVAKNYDLPKNTLYGEINLTNLLPFKDKEFHVKSVSKYPIVDRDLAVVVKEEISNADLISAIISACGKLFYEVNLFDVYRNKSLGDGVKSMAYNIRLSSDSKTLTDEEVTAVMEKVLKSLKFRYGASLR